MKKKSLILLTSAIMGLGLVGGTLAGWAVTDNADPLSIGISPGSISTDTETTYITLSWGDTQEISNVANLKLNETRRAGVLDLRADTASNIAVTGAFRKKVTGDSDLLSYLNVDVYQGDIPSYSNEATYTVGKLVIYDRAVYKCKTAVTAAEKFAPAKWDVDTSKLVSYETTPDSLGFYYKNLPIVKNEANPYTVVVYLSSTLTQTAYDALREASKKATVTFDWGIGTTEQTTNNTTKTIYYQGIAAPYIYAFKGDDVVNAKWPGVQMTAAKVAGFYTYQLDTTKYEYVVFNNNGTTQTDDLKISTYFSSTNNCIRTNSDGSNPEASVHDDTVAPEYYLKGKNLTVGTTTLNWDANPPVDYKLPAFSGESTTVTVSTLGGAELKFYDKTSNMWFANSDANFTLDQAGTYVLTFKPSGSPVISAAPVQA